MKFENYTITSAGRRMASIPMDGTIKISNPKDITQFWLIIYHPTDEDGFTKVLRIDFDSKREMVCYLSGYSNFQL